MDKNFFEGSILFESQGGKVKTLRPTELINFKVDPKIDHNLGEVLMHKFQALKFAPEEKRNLSRQVRLNIYAIQNIETQALKNKAKELCQELEQVCPQDGQIKIKAQGYGGFICLAALFSQKLPQAKKIQFELIDVPLALFPKRLIKKKEADIKLTFKVESEWMSSFESLYRCPKNLPLTNLGKVDFAIEPPRLKLAS